MRLLASLLLLIPALLAQNPYGRVTGRVTDAAGALVPRAPVRVVNVETNLATETLTNAEGNWEIPNLNPGRYRIEVQLQGFKRHERGPVELRVGDVLNIEIALELGAVSESVTITAEAPLLESSTASLGQVVDNRRILDLPLPGASPMYLTQLAPGMFSTNPPTHGWLPQAVDAVSNVGAAGTRVRSSEFALDGIPNMQGGGQISFSPPPEIIQEFRVQTAPFDASVGHFTGAHINMVLKSGANTPHGNLVFSHVSRPLMTKDFFTNRNLYDTRTGPVTKEKEDAAWPPVLTNRYRATASGPVYLPGLYDGRNRTFWTYGLDILDRVRPEQAFYTVPTPLERTGNFSELLALGSQYQIYDPATIAPAAGGRFSRQPVPGNIIPSSRLDPMAQKILTYYPPPNATGTSDGRQNYSDPQSRRIDFHSHTLRMDEAFSPNHRMFGSLTRSALDSTWAKAFHNEALGQRRNRLHFGVALDDVIALRPDLVLELRYGVTRFTQHDRPQSLGFDLASLGFPASLVNQLDRSLTSFPETVIDGYATVGNISGTRDITTFHSTAATVSQLRGNHTLRYGGEWRVLRENSYDYGNISPRIEFGVTWTRGPMDNSPAAPLGQGLASFLLGLPTGGYIDRNASFAQQSQFTGLFLQDDWKVTRKLTINVGLRWETELPLTERYNRSNRGFDFTTANPIEAAARAAYAKAPIPDVPVEQFRTLGGLLFAGVGGAPRGLFEADRNNFSPRLGLAYMIGPKWVLRGGYGVFFESIGADRSSVQQQGFNQRTSVVPSLDNGLTFRARLSNPLPDGILEPAGASAGLKTYLGRAPSFFWPQRKAGYMQRWSLNLQREFPHRVLLEMGYVGNRGTGLGLAEEFNAVPARYLSTSPVRDQPTIDYLSRAVTNPFYGWPEFAGSGLTGRTVALSQLLRPYPHFTGVSSTLATGFSWYHALQVRAEKRFSHGYTLQASYTWSKFMEAVEKLNATDLHPHHVISPQDRPHHIVVSAIYEFPFRVRGWANHLVGGWTAQGMYQGQSGPPIGFGNIVFYGNLHDIVLPRAERRVERWFNTEAGFERDSRLALASNIRKFPLRLTGLRADGYNNWDLSLFKNIRLKERLTFQLRAEAQDAMNHAMFAAPNTAPANTLFGQVSSIVGTEQRRVQVGGKLSW